jgi:recombinational DNA repair protein RecT
MYKRNNTAIAAVKTVLLGITRKKYEDVLTKSVQRQVNSKLKIISSMPFLESVDFITLIGLANNLVNL